MPISIAVVAVSARFLLGLPTGAASLLCAMLAPTDPVLAADVQVGPPGTGEEAEVKLALTSEAGLNDALAFPFVSLGMLLIESQTNVGDGLTAWALVDLFGRVVDRLAGGFVLAWTAVKVNAALPKNLRLSRADDGLVFVAITFLTYGLAQMAETYGFLAVFACAVTIRNFSPQADLHRRLNCVADQPERFCCSSGGVLHLLRPTRRVSFPALPVTPGNTP